jgi:hypothetical protein
LLPENLLWAQPFSLPEGSHYKYNSGKGEMVQRLSITEARNRLMKLPEQAGSDKIIAITRRSKQIMVLMSWGFYEGLLETIEILR